jgi:hypothetical protein
LVVNVGTTTFKHFAPSVTPRRFPVASVISEAAIVALPDAAT